MAASPQFKVYVGSDYRAAFKHSEDAAMFVAVLGEGVVRLGHGGTILWREGSEHQSASESYDEAAALMRQRMSR